MNILNKIWNEDCVGEGVGMSRIADKSVDMILCDLPYGTTSCHWDSVIPFDKLWQQYERIIKDGGIIVLTASQPFTSALIMSNVKMFKYSWVWKKSKPTGFSHSKNMPLKDYEDICVFSKASIGHKNLITNRMQYNPQGVFKVERKIKRTHKGFEGTMERASQVNEYIGEYSGFPKMVIEFSNVISGTVHPTQKPVALFEYLIKTYTNEGDLVLDNCAGSFTTAVSCENLNRNWICMEKDREYCKIGWKRIRENRLRIKSSPQLTQTL